MSRKKVLEKLLVKKLNLYTVTQRTYKISGDVMIHSKDFKTRTFLKNSPPCWVGTIMILSLFGRDWWCLVESGEL